MEEQAKSTFLTDISVVKGAGGGGGGLTFFLAGFEEGRMGDMREAVQSIQATGLGLGVVGGGSGGMGGGGGGGMTGNGMTGNGMTGNGMTGNGMNGVTGNGMTGNGMNGVTGNGMTGGIDMERAMETATTPARIVTATTTLRRGSTSGQGHHGLYSKLPGRAATAAGGATPKLASTSPSVHHSAADIRASLVCVPFLFSR